MWKLQRHRRHRWIGGVCSGLARFIGLDHFVVRILIRALFIRFFLLLWWVYLLLWVVMAFQKPDDADAPTPQADPVIVPKPQPRSTTVRLEFATLLDATRERVSERVFAKLSRIDAAARALLPHLTWWRTLQQPAFATVKRAVHTYLPQTFQHYLSLPRDYAETHKLANGLTAEEKLLADLNQLESTLNRTLESVYSHERVHVPDDLKRLGERFTPAPADGDIAATLEALMTRIQGHVPDDITARVASIQSAILAILPQISQAGQGLTQETYNVRQTALEYVPDALDKYLSLPVGFAETHTLANGKTAKETLLEQLELLDNTVKDIVGDLYQDDAEALLVHGRFLEEKFARQKFTLPADDGPPFPDLNVREGTGVRTPPTRVRT